MRAAALLVVLPVLLFAVPAAMGHPALTGDNLIQNFPLRVLAGDQIRQGHLPLWNPYIWSGSPLLAGLNSGSFYPFSFLFAVVAPVGAWVLNLLGVYWAGGLGAYALARQYRLRPLASLLGALVYAFSGTMSGQLVHIAVIQGAGWLPLLVLAAVRLSWCVLGTGPARAMAASDPGLGGAGDGDAHGAGEGRDAGPGADHGVGHGADHGVGPGAGPAARPSPWPWVALLAAVVGLEALTGEPRAIVETEIVATAVVAWQVLRPYARTRVRLAARARLLGLAALAGVWGVALAAAELAPGWTFIQASQRAAESYHFFASGSLPLPWTSLMLVPDLFGGAGLFGQVHFFNHYNLPEVTGYVGLLPLGAALVLLARSFGRRRSRLASDWGMWLAIAGLGLLLAWGASTPLGHVWALIPLFGKTRLQSRNLEILDLALAVLLAFFADQLLSSASRAPDARRLRLLGAVPAIGALVLCAVTLAAPGPVEEAMHVTAARAHLARDLWPWFGAEMLVASGVVALLVGWHRLAPRNRRRLLAGVVVVDIALFVMATSTAVAPLRSTPEPTAAAAAAVLGTHGRFAIVDSPAGRLPALTALGQPDANAFTHRPSVQGYGSIVAGYYQDATGTHQLDAMSPCALRRGVFGPLRLDTLLVSPGDLADRIAPRSLPSAGARAGAGAGTAAGAGTGTAAAARVRTGAQARGPAHADGSGHARRAAHARKCPGGLAPGTDSRRMLYLGRPADLVRATLVSTRGTRAARPAGPLTVGVIKFDGRVTAPSQSVHRTAWGWSVTFAHPKLAAGIVVEGPARDVVEASSVTAWTGRQWGFRGTYQAPIDTRTWRYVGTYRGMFAVFERTGRLRPPVWLAGAPAGSSVRQVSARDWGTTTDHVVATRPVTVVWSETYFPGWHATLSPAAPRAPAAAGGDTRRVAPSAARTRSLGVRRDGLVQSVRVPAGDWTLTFHYEPRLLLPGAAGTLLALAGFGALGVTGLVGVRRRRGRGTGTRRPAFEHAPPEHAVPGPARPEHAVPGHAGARR